MVGYREANNKFRKKTSNSYNGLNLLIFSKILYSSKLTVGNLVECIVMTDALYCFRIKLWFGPLAPRWVIEP